MQLLRNLKAPLGRAPVPGLNKPLTLREQLIPTPGRGDDGERTSLAADRAGTRASPWLSSIAAARLLCEPLVAAGLLDDTQPFTPHEWDLLAGGARALAYKAEEDAKRHDNPFLREIFEDEERAYRELAAKCEQLSREPAAAVPLALPVYRMRA
jgi:hypothetical protein